MQNQRIITSIASAMVNFASLGTSLPLAASSDRCTIFAYICAAGSISRSARPEMKSTEYFLSLSVQVIMRVPSHKPYKVVEKAPAEKTAGAVCCGADNY